MPFMCLRVQHFFYVFRLLPWQCALFAFAVGSVSSARQKDSVLAVCKRSSKPTNFDVLDMFVFSSFFLHYATNSALMVFWGGCELFVHI